MKFFTLFFVSLSIGFSASAACDSYLKTEQTDARRAALYRRDCAIQERFSAIKNFFNLRGINVNELAEYRMLRFVDRRAFDIAAQYKLHPSLIYRPAPQTWEVWDSGIRSLFGNDKLDYVLFKSYGFNKNTPGYEKIDLAHINAVLLKNENGNTSRDFIEGKSNRDSAPGTYRKNGDQQIGFSTKLDPYYQGKIDRSQDSMLKTQAQWEKDYGMKFSEAVKEHGGLLPEMSSFGVWMKASANNDGKTMFVSFAPSEMVPLQISWILTFINASIDRYRIGKPMMPPIEFAAFVQKWLVSVHPFSDGNGRTSRAVQDYILATFRMPYAPAGDLQNDSLEEYDTYINNTYSYMEIMMSKLEGCVTEYRLAKNISYRCQEVKKLEYKVW
ncbi:hypothetical protein CIK05_15870 [Bdellovibrio sp. qaytius]|nr:hypothetical protein CIK05_15870 [Bdellovibrio sp. qaytius]